MKWFANEHHVFIGGGTRSGKTVLANQVHAENDRISVFYHKSAQDKDNIRGVQVSSVSGVLAAIANGAQCVNFYWCDSSDWSGDDDLQRLVDLMFELADRSPHTSYQLIVDEVHEHVGTHPSGDNRIMRLCKTGAGSDLKGILISQNAQNISNLVLSQCFWHVWVGTPSRQDESYLDGYGYPVDRLESLDIGEYVLMTNRGELEDQGRSDPAYAE